MSVPAMKPITVAMLMEPSVGQIGDRRNRKVPPLGLTPSVGMTIFGGVWHDRRGGRSAIILRA